MYWSNRDNRWVIDYFDTISNLFKNKSFGSKYLTSDASYPKIKEFADTISDNNIFNISIQSYLSIPKSDKLLIRSLRNIQSIDWPKQNVPIDPYIFGMWLGDGNSNGRGFSSADHELVKQWVKYADTIGIEVVHYKNSVGYEGYQYGFRKKGIINDLLPIGHPDHSSATCVGCLSSTKLHPACDWVYEDRDITTDWSYIPHPSNSVEQNPYIQILKTHNLFHNKHIPEIYILNDTETRLQLIAGLIDTDGSLFNPELEGSQRFEISQSEKLRGHICDQVAFIATSLGFKISLRTYKPICKDKISGKDKTIMRLIGINGDINRIPTKLPRKKATKSKCNIDYMGAKIEINPIGRRPYVGWILDGNHRFLLGDFTVAHDSFCN
jgi:replicative DNA helicase